LSGAHCKTRAVHTSQKPPILCLIDLALVGEY
jgi:hypothetical protein